MTKAAIRPLNIFIIEHVGKNLRFLFFAILLFCVHRRKIFGANAAGRQSIANFFKAKTKTELTKLD
jgi:hypothetical protein